MGEKYGEIHSAKYMGLDVEKRGKDGKETRLQSRQGANQALHTAKIKEDRGQRNTLKYTSIDVGNCTGMQNRNLVSASVNSTSGTEPGGAHTSPAASTQKVGKLGSNPEAWLARTLWGS